MLIDSSLLPSSPQKLAPNTAGRYYRPELDVLRFLALFLVFNLHVFDVISFGSLGFLAGIQQMGATGVCLFFTLSAFLITELLLREREITDTIDIPAFYVRRFLRIWPLYLLAIGLAVLASHTIGHGFTPVGSFVIPFLLAFGNWAVVAHGWFLNPLMTPLWSISVEEQFYLIWPFLAGRLKTRSISLICFALLFVSWALDWLLPEFHITKSPALWCNSLNHFQFFAIGGGTALLMRHRPRFLSLRLPVRVILFSVAMTMLYLSARPFQFINDNAVTPPSFVLCGYLCIDAGCFLLLIAFLGAHMPRFAQPFIYLGKISYGLYVFHFAVKMITFVIITKILQHIFSKPWMQLTATYLITAAVTIAVASLSYHYFEKPFLQFKKRFTHVPSRVA